MLTACKKSCRRRSRGAKKTVTITIFSSIQWDEGEALATVKTASSTSRWQINRSETLKIGITRTHTYTHVHTRTPYTLEDSPLCLWHAGPGSRGPSLKFRNTEQIC